MNSEVESPRRLNCAACEVKARNFYWTVFTGVKSLVWLQFLLIESFNGQFSNGDKNKLPTNPCFSLIGLVRWSHCDQSDGSSCRPAMAFKRFSRIHPRPFQSHSLVWLLISRNDLIWFSKTDWTVYSDLLLGRSGASGVAGRLQVSDKLYGYRSQTSSFPTYYSSYWQSIDQTFKIVSLIAICEAIKFLNLKIRNFFFWSFTSSKLKDFENGVRLYGHV